MKVKASHHATPRHGLYLAKILNYQPMSNEAYLIQHKLMLMLMLMLY